MTTTQPNNLEEIDGLELSDSLEGEFEKEFAEMYGEPVSVAITQARKMLERKKVGDLKEICRRNKWRGWSRLKKDDLISFILANQPPSSGPPRNLLPTILSPDILCAMLDIADEKVWKVILPVCKQTMSYGKLYATILNDKTIDVAAKRGHLDAVKWFYENRNKECPSYAIYKAAKYGHLEIVKFLHKKCDWCSSSAIDGAAEHGHLGVVMWLHSNCKCGCTIDGLIGAISDNHLGVAKFIYENYIKEWSVPTRINITDHAMECAMKWATIRGYRDTVKWIHEVRR